MGTVSINGSLFEDVAIKAPVRAATTANLAALSGLLTIDTIALAAGDRVLVKNQTDRTLNGIWQVSTGPWIRPQDAVNNTDFVNGTCVIVNLGTANGGQMLTLTCTDAPVIIGTSLLIWATLPSLAPPPPAGVLSFNGRSGAVLPQAGDYPSSSTTLPTGYWSGGQHSNDISTPNTKIDIAAWKGRDSTDVFNVSVAGGIVDCTTNGINGLDTGSLGNGIWYYSFAIAKADGTSAFLASTSPTAPGLPSGYLYFRRIGAFLTDGSAHIKPFIHINDTWWWTTTIRETGGTIAVTNAPGLFACSVPRVQGVIAIFNTLYVNTATALSGIAFRPGYAPAVSVSQDGYSAYQSVTNAGGGGQFQIPVDSAARISAVCDQAANSFFNIYTNGWIDRL